MEDFDGQVAVITGGARGIGAEIARRLSSGGAHVVCADVLDTAEIVGEITAAGGSAEGREVDVTDAAAAADAVKAIHTDHGRLDILVNNAGVTHLPGPMEDISEDEFDRVLAVNVKAGDRVKRGA